MNLRLIQLLSSIVLVLFCSLSRGGASDGTDELPLAEGEVWEGQRVTFRAEVDGGVAPFKFQWYRNGVLLPNAVDALLTITSVRSGDAGAYVVTAYNDFGMVVSMPDVLAVRAVKRGRLANISMAVSSKDSVSVGFALGGVDTTGVTQLLVRAAGPALGQLGVSGAMLDPVLRVNGAGQTLGENNDWGGQAGLASVFAAAGAFSFPPLSKDAALALGLGSATYTAEVTDAAGAGGLTVVELYDLSPPESVGNPRLVNISARGKVEGANTTLVAGFNIRGNGPLTVLIRAVGPGLTQFRVPGVLSDPKLVLYRDRASIATNDNWQDGGLTDPAASARSVGAFSLAENSTDSALVVTLSPGSYTAEVTGVDGAGGVALVEVYEIP